MNMFVDAMISRPQAYAQVVEDKLQYEKVGSDISENAPWNGAGALGCG